MNLNEQLVPAPLVASHVDLSGFEYMPFYGEFLRTSKFNSRVTDGEYRAAVNLWWSAWKEIPAASLPDDDAILCRLADLGRNMRAWQKVKVGAMAGFVLCADGRWYHSFLSVLARDAWVEREKLINAGKKSGAARRAKKAVKSGEGTEQRSNTVQVIQSSTRTPFEQGKLEGSERDIKHPPEQRVPGVASIEASVVDPRAAPRETRQVEPPGPEVAIEAEDKTQAGLLAAVLRRNDITANAFHPLVIEWARDGVTVEQLRAAIATARQRKPKPERIPLAYLDPIIADALSAKRPPDTSWRHDDAAAETLCTELGIKPAKTGETRDAFNQRVTEALAKRARGEVE